MGRSIGVNTLPLSRAPRQHTLHNKGGAERLQALFCQVIVKHQT